ncbi:pentatricopeptide repeat-containing protein At5g48910-like [Phalaenopsis equestris]|uniref:pentatricopeptide repeat-containing protein At5g48910-like n=1 Tax=Phalaenopsis equestris TaxID=78828 RepID=UPI0009E53BC7|nr:pentatricopeptide repeat-containing protein At5g48910-like [Phalaenopsis equestris]
MLCSVIYSSTSPPLSFRFHSNQSSAAAPVPVDTEIRNTQSCSSSTQFSISAYNSLLRAETHAGRPNQAVLLFHRMFADDALPPNRFTFPTVLKACAHLPAVAEGEQIHSLFLKSHFAPSDDVFVLTSLVYFYSRCGRLKDARLLFDQLPHTNVASWNAMLDGYVRSGDLDSAYKLFDEMPYKNVISWNTLISGCVRNGWAWEALKLFLDFQISGMKADESTMASFIAAVADLGLLYLGRMAHAHVTRSLFSSNGALGVAFIDMYAKCGSIKSAYNVFTTIESKNIRHWTSMIAGFASHGSAYSALQLFDKMMNSGTMPNDITFIAVLNACSHGGLVYEGLECFKLMKTYKVEPGVKHYGCLVDLLGRAGLVDGAMEIVRDMPVEPTSVIWCSLLAACRNYGYAEVADVVAGKLIELDSNKGSSFVLLSNLYGGLGRLEDFGGVRKAMADRAVTKVAGFSWIEIDGQVHEFVCGDMLHFRRGEIYGVLEEMRSYLGWQQGSDSLGNYSLSIQ